MQNLGRIARKTNGVTALNATHQYIGRFAPSPTGPLHFGSLFTALASFLQARSQQGLWRLRIDDLDYTRNVRGAADSILKTLDNFGLHWDGPVIYQSRETDSYHAAIDRLIADKRVYRCTCSRKILSEHQRQYPATAHRYPGFCRDAVNRDANNYALRIRTSNATVAFDDALQGRVEHALADRHGDFIVLRRDRVIAYQLAAAVDDRQQLITEVVRGYDLLDSTPKQIYLQQLLGYASPRYLHVPVIVDAHGQKLSKQSFAEAVDRHDARTVLFELLGLFQLQPPSALRGGSIEELLAWGSVHWRYQRLRRLCNIAMPSGNHPSNR